MRSRPDRFAVFGYAHVPSFKKHQRKIDAAALPGGAGTELPRPRPSRRGSKRPATGASASTTTRSADRPHGDRPGRAARLHRNFQGYTTDAAPTLIGLGASAIGRLPQGYVQNEPTVRAYAAAIGAGRLATCKGFALTLEDRLRGDLIERLMCDFRVDVDAVCRRHHQPVDRVADAFPATRPSGRRRHRAPRRRRHRGAAGGAEPGARRRRELRFLSAAVDPHPQPGAVAGPRTLASCRHAV